MEIVSTPFGNMPFSHVLWWVIVLVLMFLVSTWLIHTFHYEEIEKLRMSQERLTRLLEVKLGVPDPNDSREIGRELVRKFNERKKVTAMKKDKATVWAAAKKLGFWRSVWLTIAGLWLMKLLSSVYCDLKPMFDCEEEEDKDKRRPN